MQDVWVRSSSAAVRAVVVCSAMTAGSRRVQGNKSELWRGVERVLKGLSPVQVNKATMNMLRRVEPYITWGTPNLKSVKELIYKRGYGKVSWAAC